MNWTLHVRLLQSPEASIKSHGSRSKPPSSSQLLKRHRSRNSPHSRRPSHHLLLQIGGARSERLSCSLRVNGSKPPSSSQLLKPQRSPSSLHSRRPSHHLLLQIGGARHGGLELSRAWRARLPSQPRKRTPERPIPARLPSQPRKRTPERADTCAYAITAAKTYAKGRQ
jgi:hypothetical protein